MTDPVDYKKNILALERQFIDLSESNQELGRRISFLKEFTDAGPLKLAALEAVHHHANLQLKEIAETIASSRIELIQLAA